MCGAAAVHQHSTNTYRQNPMPSPAGSVSMLVGNSSHQQSGRPFVPTDSNTRSSPTPLPSEDLESIVPVLVRHLLGRRSLRFRCHNCHAINIGALENLLKAFNDARHHHSAGHHSSAGRDAKAPEDANVNAVQGSAPAPLSNAESRGTEAPRDVSLQFSKGPAVASPPSNTNAEETQHLEAVFENGSSKHPEAANVKKSGARGSREKDETLSLASGRNTMAPSSGDVVGDENSNGRATEPVFEVKRKSKNGEALALKTSDLSPLFGLRSEDAAKELGISATSLKKAVQHLDLHRWPGRKVRSFKCAIDGLERFIAGQGADLENFRVARSRALIPELKRELNELLHGTSEEIRKIMQSPSVILTNVGKLLGWRSEYHSPGHDDINTGNEPNLASGLAPPSARENSMGPDQAVQAKKTPCTNDPVANQPTPNAGQERPPRSVRKYIRPSQRPILRSSSRLGSRATEMKASDLEGLLPEVPNIINVAGREVREGVVQARNNMMTWTAEIREEGTRDRGVAEDDTLGERSPKRPKVETLRDVLLKIQSRRGSYPDM